MSTTFSTSGRVKMLLFLACSYPRRSVAFHGLFLRSRTTTSPQTTNIRLFGTPSPTSSASDSTIKKKKKKKATSTSTSIPFPTVILKRSVQSKSFRSGNPLVFTKAIQTAPHDLEMASIVHVAVTADTASHPPVPIGVGVYNPQSLYKIRLLLHTLLQPSLYSQVMSSSPSPDTDSNDTAIRCILEHHIQSAFTIRNTILSLPNSETDTYRLINGEGDGLSGLAVDILAANIAVVMSSAAWCERYRSIITDVLLQQLSGEGETSGKVLWKTTPSRLKQDGIDVPKNKDDGNYDDSMVIAKENGIYYETYPGVPGQKTSVYCDQRENRRILASYCQGKTVLDLCCYSGSFSLNAAKNGGAVKCLGVDSSQEAIEAAIANAARNGVESICSFVKSDITAFLQDSKKDKPQYDVVILDPPKLAPSLNVLDKASRKYRGLNRDAIAAVDDMKGGVLMTCTCSAAMTQQDGGRYFLRLVQQAAMAAGKQVTLLSVHGAAPCHTESPAAHPAGAYLTAAVFFVHPKE